MVEMQNATHLLRHEVLYSNLFLSTFCILILLISIDPSLATAYSSSNKMVNVSKVSLAIATYDHPHSTLLINLTDIC